MTIKVKRHNAISVLVGIIILLSTTNISYEVYDSIKTSSIFSISLISITIGLLSPFININNKIRLNIIDILATLFIIYNVINNLQSPSLWNSALGYLIILYISLRFIKTINYKLIYNSTLIATVLLSSWGYLQYFEFIPSNNNYFPITGPFHNPTILSGVMCLLLCIIINTFINSAYLFLKKKRTLLLVFSIVLFSMPIFFLSFSRAAWLALFCSTGMTLYSTIRTYESHRKRKNRIYQSIFVIVIIMLLILSLFVLYRIKPQSADGRLLIWKVSCEMIKDKPLTGFGRDGFAANYMYYQAKYLETNGGSYDKYLAGNTHLAFNEPLRIMVEYGAGGLLFYLLFIASVVIPQKNSGTVFMTAQAVVIGIIVWGLFSYPNEIFPIMILFTIALAFFSKKYKIHILPIKQLPIKAICAITAISAGLMIKQTINNYTVYHRSYIFLKGQNMNDLSRYSNEFRRFKTLMRNEPSFLKLYCLVLQKQKKEHEFFKTIGLLEHRFPSPALFLMKGDYLYELGKLDEAEKAYRLAYNMEPSKQMAHARLALLYYETGRVNEAVVIARSILTEKVKVYGFETFELHRNLKQVFGDLLK